jgi:multidrug efflux pump subunit AcrB
LLIGGGIWAAFGVQKEVLPDFELDVVEVSVRYPGAAPTEVEQGILLPVEEAVRGVQGIKEVTSTAREGSGSISVELVAGVERMKVYQDIDQAVSRIRTFPDEIEQPEVRLRSQQREVLLVEVYGEVDPWDLRVLAERLRDTLLAHESITQVEIRRVPDYVTHVEIPHLKLREYGLTLGRVARIIEESSRDVPAGSVETSGGEILLRLQERKQWAEEFAEVVILTSDEGSVVTLGDLATIRDGFEETGFQGQFNQTPSVGVQVFRVGAESPLEVAAAVEETMASFQTSLPPGVEWRIDNNSAEDYRERLSLLLENGGWAVLIVLGILALFLEIKLAFWVMMGMVISFVGGMVFLPVVGESINMISMFAFLVVLGIVVDDAVVVGENVYEYRQRGMDRMTAAIRGTQDIARPVVFSIMTNIIAFVPLLYLPGTTGKFWWPLPAVVIIVLVVSLAEALFILPAHLAHSRERKRTQIGGYLHKLQRGFANGFERFVDRWFGAVLTRCLRNRYVTLVAGLGLLVIVSGYASSSHMGMIMMPEMAADEIEAGVRLPVGTTSAQAARMADKVTEATRRMFEEHDLYRVAEGIKTNVRGQNFVDVEIVMRPPDEHDMSTAEIIELWRSNIGDIPGVHQITFEAETGPGSWQKDISIDLSHADIEVLEKASIDLLARSESYAAARDVSDNYDRGKAQFDLTLRPEARLLGFTSEELGRQVRDSFYGALAMRQLRGTNEIEVRVKLPKSEREDLQNFEDLVVFTPAGTEVPLLDVAEVERTEAFTSINRRNGRRVINVNMNVEPKREVGRVLEAIQVNDLPELRALYPGLTWTFEGSQAEMRESTAALWSGFTIAMAIMYCLLAIAFSSYLQPLIVMIAIPFGIVGAVLGHMLLGYDLSLVSVMGLIALSGVVVNDSLIMIDHANRNRGDRSAFEAIHRAGLRRFRPIMLTTLTTFGGLTPIIFETSRQAYTLIPMAISLGFGIIFSTAIILLLVPCLYLVIEDSKKRAAVLIPVAE